MRGSSSITLDRLKRKKASELGVTGFVHNEPDGSVYLEAEGDEDTLKKLMEWCWEGPAEAEVKKVVAENGVVKSFEAFEIRSF